MQAHALRVFTVKLPRCCCATPTARMAAGSNGRQGREATCKCTHIPACRHDHHTKQAPGWTLTSPTPGTLTWTTPGNRTHTTTPAEYWE